MRAKNRNDDNSLFPSFKRFFEYLLWHFQLISIQELEGLVGLDLLSLQINEDFQKGFVLEHEVLLQGDQVLELSPHQFDCEEFGSDFIFVELKHLSYFIHHFFDALFLFKFREQRKFAQLMNCLISELQELLFVIYCFFHFFFVMIDFVEFLFFFVFVFLQNLPQSKQKHILVCTVFVKEGDDL